MIKFNNSVGGFMSQKLLKKIKMSMRWLTDEQFIRLYYWIKFKKSINLNNPKSYNEKLNWMKLYDRNPLYTKLADKLAVRDYVSERIGSEYLVPLLGVFDSFDQIDFSELPEQFVLKCNHDSGCVEICKDRKKFDVDAARKNITKALATNYFYSAREWQYKNIEPRIICEELLVDSVYEVPIDYKIQCFNGVPCLFMVCINRYTEGGVKFCYYDLDWNYLNNINTLSPLDDPGVEKPQNLQEMIEIAKALSKGLKTARIDLYVVNGKVYFGEITFAGHGGFHSSLTDYAEFTLGNKIELDL